jgi:biotin carboxyl carrier protein
MEFVDIFESGQLEANIILEAWGKMADRFFVVSPISGIFYRTPSPDSPPYVEVGQQVKAKDVLCLVEQMKVFTVVEAGRDGIISRIMVEQEATVSEGQLLFEVEAL